MKGSEKNTGNAIVLIVDDVEMNREILDGIVNDMGYRTVLAENGLQALECIKEGLPNLVLTDISMPEMDGYELCRVLKANVETRDIPIIFISAFDATKDIVKGFGIGGGDYITKPFIPELVRARVNVHLKLYEATLQVREANRRLQVSVKEQLKQMEQERKDMLYALAGMAAEYSVHGEDYIDRVRYNCRVLAQSMQISPQFDDLISDSFVDVVELAAPLCDIGNIGVPKDILRKKGALDQEEQEVMRGHTRIGAKLLKDLKVSNEFMQISMDVAQYHHENWDGSGYPDGLKGDNIPLAAQIVAIMTKYTVLTGSENIGCEYALKTLASDSGTDFSPEIYKICCKIARQLC